MRIVNAGNTVKVFFTGQGHLIKVKPGEISEVLVPDGNIIKQILSYSSTKVAMILEDEYDYRIQKTEAPAAANGGYVYTSVAQAKAKMLEGRDFTPVTSVNEVLTLKTEIDAKDTEIEKLRGEISELNITVTQCKAEVEPLTKKNIELNKEIIKTKGENENLTDVNNNLRSKLSDVQAENSELLKIKASLESSINSSTEIIAKKDKDIELLKTEGKKCVADNEMLRGILNDIVTTYKMVEVDPEKHTWRIPEEKRTRRKKSEDTVEEVSE